MSHASAMFHAPTGCSTYRTTHRRVFHRGAPSRGRPRLSLSDHSSPSNPNSLSNPGNLNAPSNRSNRSNRNNPSSRSPSDLSNQ